jgi:hypothetical protein
VVDRRLRLLYQHRGESDVTQLEGREFSVVGGGLYNRALDQRNDGVGRACWASDADWMSEMMGLGVDVASDGSLTADWITDTIGLKARTDTVGAWTSASATKRKT